MVSPDRYNMASDMPHPRVAGRPCCRMTPADRLEAAIDNALLDEASMGRLSGRRNRLMQPGDEAVVFVCARRGMGGLGWWLPGYTKRDVVSLFERCVMKRYAAGGWADMAASYDYPQSRTVVFSFGIDKPAKRLFLGGLEFRVTRGRLTRKLGLRITGAEPMHIRGPEVVRMMSWLTRAGMSPQEIDGMGRQELRNMLHALVCALDAETMTSKPGWLRATLDDLRVSAKLKRFDLDMTKRDGLGPSDHLGGDFSRGVDENDDDGG